MAFIIHCKLLPHKDTLKASRIEHNCTQRCRICPNLTTKSELPEEKQTTMKQLKKQSCIYCGYSGKDLETILHLGQMVSYCIDFKSCVDRMTKKIVKNNLKKVVTNNG